MSQVKVVFFLPLRDNDGRSLSWEILEAEMELYELFGGITNRGLVKGKYRMTNGSDSKDVLRVFEIVTQEGRVHEIEHVLKGFKAKTTQESIYCEIQKDTDVRFL